MRFENSNCGSHLTKEENTMHMKNIKTGMLATLAMMLSATMALAQEPAAQQAPAPQEAPAAQQAPAPQEAPAAHPEAQPQEAAPAPSNDPGDVIANYFMAMSDLVAQNIDNPTVLTEKFAAYLRDNEKAMREASKKFDAKMGSLKTTEAEVYRETVQRKITPQLNKLISLLIDFSSRYPTEAAKLDSMLKVDAKYTYQQ